MAKNYSTNRIWMVVAIAFFLISLALGIYIAYEKIRDSIDKTDDMDIFVKYPGYFRTPEEQEDVEKDWKSDPVTPATVVNHTSLEFCEFSCFNPINLTSTPSPSTRRRRAAYHSLLPWTTVFRTAPKMLKKRAAAVEGSVLGPPTYHGCCISRHKFISPYEAQDLDGNTVLLAQFSNHRQYFLSQECRHANGCTGCGCGQELTITAAVVRNKDYPKDSMEEYVIGHIKYPGCCKCFNGLVV